MVSQIDAKPMLARGISRYSIGSETDSRIEMTS